MYQLQIMVRYANFNLNDHAGLEGGYLMENIDIKKQLKELYGPSDKDFVLVEVPQMQFLMIEGEGSPQSDCYVDCVKWLFSVIYPIKFIAKKMMSRNFVAPPLEGLWWADDMDDFINGNQDNWKWQMMIATPDWISTQIYDEAVDKAAKKLGEVPDSLRLEKFREGLSVQILHKGPYDEEAPVIARLHNEFLPANNLSENGHHHEIYLNDPRRTAPQKLKTVLRQPVRKIDNT